MLNNSGCSGEVVIYCTLFHCFSNGTKSLQLVNGWRKFILDHIADPSFKCDNSRVISYYAKMCDLYNIHTLYITVTSHSLLQ